LAPTEFYKISLDSLVELKNGKEQRSSEIDFDDLRWTWTRPIETQDTAWFSIKGKSRRSNAPCESIQFNFTVTATRDIMDIQTSMKIQDYDWKTRGTNIARNLQVQYSLYDLIHLGSRVRLNGTKAYLNNLYFGLNSDQTQGDVTDGRSSYKVNAGVDVEGYNQVNLVYSGFSSNHFDALQHKSSAGVNSPLYAKEASTEMKLIEVTVPEQEEISASNNMVVVGIAAGCGFAVIAGVASFVVKKVFRSSTRISQP